MLYLETERLLLRNYKEKDAEDCFAFLSDRETCYLDGGYEPFESIDKEYNELMQKFKEQDNRLMIVLKGEDKVIGTIHIMEDERRWVEAREVGYVISPGYRRKGYATEAINEVIRYCFEDAKVDMITAGIISQNIPSLNLIKKLGFKKEGEIHNGFIYPPVGLVSLESFFLEKKV